MQAEWAPPVIFLTENGSTYDDVVGPDGRSADVERRSYLSCVDEDRRVSGADTKGAGPIPGSGPRSAV